MVDGGAIVPEGDRAAAHLKRHRNSGVTAWSKPSVDGAGGRASIDPAPLAADPPLRPRTFSAVGFRLKRGRDNVIVPPDHRVMVRPASPPLGSSAGPALRSAGVLIPRAFPCGAALVFERRGFM